MDGIRSYLLSVVAVCMISVLANAMVRHEMLNKLVRFVSGILTLLVVASPLLTLDTAALAERLEEYCAGANFDTELVTQNAREQLAAHIKQTTESYIESKAAELGAAIQAEVTLTDEEYPTPYAVTLIGTLTTQQMAALSDYLTDALAIPAERQEWRLYGTTD